MEAFSKLRDCLYYCSHCGVENFFDFERDANGQHQNCWHCRRKSVLPMRLDIGHRKLFLNHDAELFPHHLGDRLDFGKPCGMVNQHPRDPRKWGLKNLGVSDWSYTTRDGQTRVAGQGRSVPLMSGMRLNFGPVEGVILSR